MANIGPHEMHSINQNQTYLFMIHCQVKVNDGASVNGGLQDFLAGKSTKPKQQIP